MSSRKTLALFLPLCFLGLFFLVLSSKPGDVVYASVKIGLFERIERVLALSTNVRTEVEFRQFERRLFEWESLAAAKKLTPEAQTALMQAFQQSAKAALKDMEVVAPISPDTAAAFSSRAQAIVLGHTAILHALEPQSIIVLPLTEWAAKLEAAGKNATQQIVGGRPTEVTKGYAEKALEKAKKQVRMAEGFVVSGSGMELYLSTARDAIASAEENLKSTAYGAAFELSNRAWRQAYVLTVTLRAATQYGVEIPF